ncbi:MAG: hypothetical protein WD737_01315 [Gemmatimonadota bacterium]
MDTVKWMLAGIAVGAAAVTLRELQRRRLLSPALPTGAVLADVEEPVLGYDGMDQETLLEWLEDAELDDSDVRRIMRYEEANFGREPVLEVLGELLG